MEIACAKGCGYNVTVPKEAMVEMLEAGGVINVSHEVCPNAPDAPKREFRIVTKVFGDIHNADGERIEGGELLAQIGGKVEAPTFAQAVEQLGRELQEQLEQVVGMTDLVDQPKEEGS